jgi:hypothetical protein
LPSSPVVCSAGTSFGSGAAVGAGAAICGRFFLVQRRKTYTTIPSTIHPPSAAPNPMYGRLSFHTEFPVARRKSAGPSVVVVAADETVSLDPDFVAELASVVV